MDNKKRELSTVCKLSEMRRNEYIRWEWLAVAEFGEAEIFYIRGLERDIADAKGAAENFDLMRGAYLTTRRVSNHNERS